MTSVPTLLAAGGFNPLAFDASSFLLTVLTVLVLFFLLAKFAWGPIVAGIEAREDRIGKDIAEAEKARQNAHDLLEDYQSKLSNVEAEMAALRDKGRAEAEALRAELLAKAEADAKDRTERALREIEQASAHALEEIRTEAVNIGMAVASKVVGRSVDGDDQQRLAREVVAGLGNVGTN